MKSNEAEIMRCECTFSFGEWQCAERHKPKMQPTGKKYDRSRRRGNAYDGMCGRRSVQLGGVAQILISKITEKTAHIEKKSNKITLRTHTHAHIEIYEKLKNCTKRNGTWRKNASMSQWIRDAFTLTRLRRVQ